MSCFFETWRDARQAFISKIEILGGTYESIALSSKGPDQSELSIGIGIVRIGTARGSIDRELVLHISGVHGVEGFAGSAAQLHILDELQSDIRSGKFLELPSRTIVFIHSVNAFGMSWFRRNNAQNVDLNRNAIPQGQSLPQSDAYTVVHQILMDRSGLSWIWPLRMAGLILNRGKNYVMQGLSGGQYQFADGFFYGGTGWQEELVALSDYLIRNFASADKVFVIDIHTGLGPYGNEALFAHDGADADDVATFSRNLNVTLTLDQIAGEETYRASGGFAHVIYGAFPKSKVRYILQEFGTFNGFSVLRGLRGEHLAWLEGRFGPEKKASKALKRLFFPEDRAWRLKVLTSSTALFKKVVWSGFR